MVPIRIAETERDDFDGTIVEMWRGDDFIGMVFWDGETPIVQIYPSQDGDVHDLDLPELLRVLDTAIQIVDPHAFDDDDLGELREAAQSAQGDDVHPATGALLAEFDPRAVFRSEHGEGFFDRQVAKEFIARCEELGLAVVEMEGFLLEGAALNALPDHDLAVVPQSIMTASQFSTYANATVAGALDGWNDSASLVVAFVFQQADGETIVA